MNVVLRGVVLSPVPTGSTVSTVLPSPAVLKTGRRRDLTQLRNKLL